MTSHYLLPQERLHFMHHVTLFVAVHSQMTHYIQFNHFQCHYIIIRPLFFWRNVDYSYWKYWLIDWCLMPTLAVCQLYRDIWKYFESMPFTLMCFSSHSNAMMSWQSCLAQKIMCNFIPIFYHHRCGDTTSCIRQTAFFNFKRKRI